MKILITGAAGFLGSHLTSKFLTEGHQVVGIDDLSTGTKENIEKFFSNKNFQFIEHDVREPINVDFEGVLNFACPASPVQYQRDPVRTIETNFLGMTHILRKSRELGARVLQASTSEVYGDPEISPQVETYWGNVNPIGIRSCYDEGKRAAETLCFDYLRQYSVDARVIRIFNTYGPNMAVGDGRVVSNFIVQALTNQPITIYGDGSQTISPAANTRLPGLDISSLAKVASRSRTRCLSAAFWFSSSTTRRMPSRLTPSDESLAISRS